MEKEVVEIEINLQEFIPQGDSGLNETSHGEESFDAHKYDEALAFSDIKLE